MARLPVSNPQRGNVEVVQANNNPTRKYYDDIIETRVPQAVWGYAQKDGKLQFLRLDRKESKSSRGEGWVEHLSLYANCGAILEISEDANRYNSGVVGLKISVYNDTEEGDESSWMFINDWGEFYISCSMPDELPSMNFEGFEVNFNCTVEDYDFRVSASSNYNGILLDAGHDDGAGGVVLACPSSALANERLTTDNLHFYMSGNDLKVKVKLGNGTVQTGTVCTTS